MNDLKFHVGHATENPGDVAMAIAPAGVSQEDLKHHVEIIAMHPDRAREVAAQIVQAADAADAYRAEHDLH